MNELDAKDTRPLELATYFIVAQLAAHLVKSDAIDAHAFCSTLEADAAELEDWSHAEGAELIRALVRGIRGGLQSPRDRFSVICGGLDED